MVTQQEVLNAQEAWADAIVKIGELKNDKIKCEKATVDMLKGLYAFEKGKVLFKPTKASETQFRTTMEAAKSYFIGGNVHFFEDRGFALQPWTKVRFENAHMILEEKRAIVMGNYFFTDVQGHDTKVEFTFGYVKNKNGELKIDVHHSSLPFGSH